MPIEDPTRTGKYGQPAVSGVRLEVDEQQAEVVRRVFEMYARGLGLAQISKQLNAEGVPAPQPPRTRSMQAWCPSSIREMLRNERYRGVQVWNRTQKQRNPETGRKISRARPKSEWVRSDVPEWRIVPEELWKGVEARIKTVHDKVGAARLGGMNRTEQSRKYLFSGLLKCGVCGSRMVIISGGGLRGYVRYGCPSHRYRGVCSNALTIRRDRLEEQLLGALEERIFRADLIEYTLTRFHAELQKRLTEIQKHSEQTSSRAVLEQQRRDLEIQARRLADAVAAAGHSPTLLTRLAATESEIESINCKLEQLRPVNLKIDMEETREFVLKNVLQLRRLIRQDASLGKAALMKHLGQLTLTPRDTEAGKVFDVSGGLDLLSGRNDVMAVVARDGIEPPTPAFSGLDSSMAIAFKTKGKGSLNVPKTAHLLGQEWDKILAGQNCLSHCCPTPPLYHAHNRPRDACRCRSQRKGRYTTVSRSKQLRRGQHS